MSLLFAATGDGVVRLLETNDGWMAVASLAGSGTRCLALDPLHPGTIYAGGAQGVYRSQDECLTWENVSPPVHDVFSIAVSPVDGAVYAGTEPSMLFRSHNQGDSWEELDALRRIPSASTWSFPPRPWTSHVRWIAPSPHDAQRILAGIELGGMMLSTDGGTSWSDHPPGAQKDVHSVVWHPSARGRAYEAGGGGAAWTRDAGMTWEPLDGGRDRHYTWAVAADPQDPDRWFLSASTGPMDAHRGGDAHAVIYRSDGDGPWRPLTPELHSMVYALAAEPGRIFYGMANGQLACSLDRGDKWQPLHLFGDRVPSVSALALRS